MDRKMTKQLLLFLVGLAAWGQVIGTTTTPGSGYTSTPSASSTGGGCTTQPTYQPVLNTSNNTVSGVSATFAGKGCTSAPTITISGGGGSGATATAVMLPYQVVLLSTVNSSFCGSVQATLGSNSCTAFQFACYAETPAQRVPFVAAGLFLFPGMSQKSSQVSPPASIVAALTSGIISEFTDSVIIPVGTATAAIEGMIAQDCTNAETNFASWNPYAFNGTNLSLSGSWTITTIP
jgi:hypothetical protein